MAWIAVEERAVFSFFWSKYHTEKIMLHYYADRRDVLTHLSSTPQASACVSGLMCEKMGGFTGKRNSEIR